jgi:hypothetical protein
MHASALRSIALQRVARVDGPRGKRRVRVCTGWSRDELLTHSGVSRGHSKRYETGVGRSRCDVASPGERALM